ncbi:hypothetical protein ACLOJK_041185 [Asimina triloba]
MALATDGDSWVEGSVFLTSVEQAGGGRCGLARRMATHPSSQADVMARQRWIVAGQRRAATVGWVGWVGRMTDPATCSAWVPTCGKKFHAYKMAFEQSIHRLFQEAIEQ